MEDTKKKKKIEKPHFYSQGLYIDVNFRHFQMFTIKGKTDRCIKHKES